MQSPYNSHVPLVPPLKNCVAVSLIASRSNWLQVKAEHIPLPTPVSPISLHSSATASVGCPNPYHHTTNYTGPSGSYLSLQGISTAQFNDALRKELAGNTLDVNSNFLKWLLPHKGLPFPVNEGLLRKLSAPMPGCTNLPIWNELKSCFRLLRTHLLSARATVVRRLRLADGEILEHSEVVTLLTSSVGMVGIPRRREAKVAAKFARRFHVLN